MVGDIERNLHTSERILHTAPRRQVELRITSALSKKAEAFRRYRDEGIMGDKDSCIVAITAAQFALQAATGGLHYGATAVYPFGEEQITIDRKTGAFVKREFTLSESIERKAKPDDPIKRTAFQSEALSDISGIIWSRASIGNFFVATTRDDLKVSIR